MSDPYGKLTIYDATWSNTRSTSSYDNVILYTGRELDPETGMMHYRLRYYHPELGRFLVRDPLGFVTRDFNLYGYVESGPLTQVDPMGLAPEEDPTRDWTPEMKEDWKEFLEEMKNAKSLGAVLDAIKELRLSTLTAAFSAGLLSNLFSLTDGLEDFGGVKPARGGTMAL